MMKGRIKVLFTRSAFVGLKSLSYATCTSNREATLVTSADHGQQYEQ